MLLYEYIFSHFIVRNNSREYSCFTAAYRTCVSIKIWNFSTGADFYKMCIVCFSSPLVRSFVIIVDAFAQPRKASISFAMSVPPSVRLSVQIFQRRSQWTDYPMGAFTKISRENPNLFKIWQNKWGTVHEDVSFFYCR